MPLLMRVAMEDEQVEQDALDGEAMRRLITAVTAGELIEVSEDPEDDDDLRFLVRVVVGGPYGKGGTVSEAADACRHALEDGG